MRVLLTGCGKAKAPGPTWAELLYTGSLARARASYARASGLRWWILSAKLGLLDPNQFVAPYDQTLSDLAPIDRSAWALGVAQALLDELEDDDDPRELVVEIHAGAAYVKQLGPVLEAIGARVELPLKGLGIGEQLAWYKQQREAVA